MLNGIAGLQGRIVEVKGSADEARVIYDDDMEEWLSLTRERFQWLAPRAQSAGGTPELQVRVLHNRATSQSPLAPLYNEGTCSALNTISVKMVLCDTLSALKQTLAWGRGGQGLDLHS